MEQIVTIVIPLAFLACSVGIAVLSDRLSRTEQRLNALRSNCSIRNERGQMLRYVNASPEVRARAESTITERTA